MQQGPITIDTIAEIARQVYHKEDLPLRVEDDGFVIQHMFGRCTFVGVREEDETWIVGKMWSETETINRNDARLQTSQSRHVKCRLFRVELPEPEFTNEYVEEIADRIDGKEYEDLIGTGYVHGYRCTPIEKVIEEDFD